jgi:serine/threonine-protein kinase
MIRFRMMGTVDLRAADGCEIPSVLRRPKLVALLAYLGIARPPGFHRRDTLVALLWPELDTAHARNALRQAVHTLREALGQDVLLARGEEEVGVSEERLWCDVREFERALEAGEAEKSLELYRGSLLTGLHLSAVPDFERWLDQEREHVRQRACVAARLLTDRACVAGNVTGAAGWALRLTELSPSDETAIRRLIELLDRAGDRAGAVRAYGEFERRLGRDLELEPSAETQALVRSIRARGQHDGRPAVAPMEVLTGGKSAGNGDGAARTTNTLAASASAIDGDASAPLPDRSRPRALRVARVATKRAAALFGVGLSGLLAVGWLMFQTPFGARSAEAGRDAKRLVVLPFANLGAAEDEYFAAGLTEEISAQLGAIDRVRITGSTSANRYKNTKKTLPEIGEELAVDYVLEGTVRWQKSPHGPTRVRVTPELVSIKDGTRLWAQVYDEPLDEIFRVQSDIAQKVVEALGVAFSQPQGRVVAIVPTRSLEAYDFYLRGNDYMRHGTDGRTLRAAARMYEKAVELDPDFALAYAWLSRVYVRMYWAYFDHSKERLVQARRAADRALKLGPDLAETHQALAIYYGLGRQDYDRAMHEYASAEARGGNVFLGRATVRVRQGKIREAIADYERARQLDPASSTVASNYGQPYDLLRENARAEALYDRAIMLAPDRTEPYLLKIWLYLRWDGNTQRARAVLAEAQAAGVADQPPVLYARVLMEIFDRRYEHALALLSSNAPEIILADNFRVVPRAQLYALVYALTQRPDLARAYYDSARSILYKKVQEDPDDPRLRTAIGIAYAGLGRRHEAIEEGRQAVELMPTSKDAFKGYHHAWELTRIYTMVGEYDVAINQLEHLLSVPGQLTAAWLRMDPVWDPLRSDPRFQKLVSREK